MGGFIMSSPYELIMRIQQKMQDPKFAAQFNALAQKLSNIPGLQQEVMRIAQIQDSKKRQKAIDKLPPQVKTTVEEMMRLVGK